MATSKKKKSAKQVKSKRGSASGKTAKTKPATAKKSTVKRAGPKKKAAAKKTASKRTAPKKSAKSVSKKASKKAPKKKAAAARGGRTSERPAQALHSTEPEERIKSIHHDMEDEPAPRRREPGEPVELGEEMEDELGDGLPLDDDEETEGDFLDKPEDLSSDEDTE